MELMRRNAASFWFDLAHRRSIDRGSGRFMCGTAVPQGGRADGGDGRRLVRARRRNCRRTLVVGAPFLLGGPAWCRHSTFLIASLNGGFPFWHRYF
jgi:hypothetical protein